jgi:hypothetical protein
MRLSSEPGHAQDSPGLAAASKPRASLRSISFALSTAMTMLRIASSFGCACAYAANTPGRAVACVSTSAGPFGSVAIAGFFSRWGGDPLAGPVLTAPLIPNRSFDTERLQEESLAELANAQKVGDDVALSDLVGADDPPAFALLDLSVRDSRFLPALIAAQLAHLVESWEEAVLGPEAPFEALASADARAALLRPRPGTRLVIRDAVLKSWSPTRLDLSQRRPAIEVTLEVDAVRYAVTDKGRHCAGNDTDVRRMVLEWTLELIDSARAPWHLAISNCPAEAIPGWS